MGGQIINRLTVSCGYFLEFMLKADLLTKWEIVETRCYKNELQAKCQLNIPRHVNLQGDVEEFSFSSESYKSSSIHHLALSLFARILY